MTRTHIAISRFKRARRSEKPSPKAFYHGVLQQPHVQFLLSALLGYSLRLMRLKPAIWEDGLTGSGVLAISRDGANVREPQKRE